MVCAWIYWVIRKGERAPEFLCLGAISAVALLPVYHRFYDAALLAVPLCWCIANAGGDSKIFAKLGLAIMTPFLFPGSAFLQQMAVQGRVPVSLNNSWLWNCVVVPHETWALLLMSALLIYAVKASSSNATEV